MKLKAFMYRGMLLLAVLLIGLFALAACGETEGELGEIEVEEPEIEEEGEIEVEEDD